MIKCQPIIAVKNVAESSKWYCALLDCRGLHGGDEFEMLADERDEIFLCLHKWGEHDHPTLTESNAQAGNGLIIYIHVNELEKAWGKASELNAQIEESPHLNTNSGRREFCIRDLDNYYLMITE